jgi:hypothetical protein
MTTCSRSRSSSGFLKIGAFDDGRIRRYLLPAKRFGAWSSECVREPGLPSYPPIPCDTASLIASSARAAKTWSRSRRCWVFPPRNDAGRHR